MCDKVEHVWSKMHGPVAHPGAAKTPPPHGEAEQLKLNETINRRQGFCPEAANPLWVGWVRVRVRVILLSYSRPEQSGIKGDY